MKEYLKILETCGFVVVRRKIPKELPAVLLKRYKNIPADYLTFLSQFEQVTHREGTSWFISIEDFNGETDTDFEWNNFELQSLKTLEGDEDECKNMRSFWNNHIPILMAVTTYEYLAICLEDGKHGEIVHGVEPIVEDTSKVCNSFEELMILFEKPLVQT